jgi:hypothetical protein
MDVALPNLSCQSDNLYAASQSRWHVPSNACVDQFDVLDTTPKFIHFRQFAVISLVLTYCLPDVTNICEFFLVLQFTVESVPMHLQINTSAILSQLHEDVQS